jgi:polyisoprenyl-phosphate glycosyltransferase
MYCNAVFGAHRLESELKRGRRCYLSAQAPSTPNPAPSQNPPERRVAGTLSVVVPCYNEAEVIDTTQARLTKVLSAMGCPYELVYVNDGSRDTTPEQLDAIAAQDPHVRVVHFSRNFGHQFAVTAGFDHARGDCVLLMDCDLQDPPELIPEMYGLWQQGHDVVYGQRISRDGESSVKKATARWFYRTLNALSDVDMPLDTGDFRLMDRTAVDAIKSMRERDRYVRGMVSWVGFDQKPFRYNRDARAAGQTKYNYPKMLLLAADGIMSFSLAPLRLVLFIGFAIVGVAMLGGLLAVFNRLFTDDWVSGWTGLFLAVLFMNGVQLMVLGVIGEYVGRIYMAAKDRPLYIVKRRVGFEPTFSVAYAQHGGRSGGDPD